MLQMTRDPDHGDDDDDDDDEEEEEDDDDDAEEEDKEENDTEWDSHFDFPLKEPIHQV